MCGTLERIPQPTPAEPVKVIARVSSCSTIALPTAEPGPGMTESQPSGRPASWRTRASFRAEIGVCPAGLRTIALPAAIAGPSLWATRLSGKLKGLIAADDAVGHPQHHPELALARGRGLHRHRAAGQLARLGRGEGEGGDAALRLDGGGLQRLAGLGGDRQRQVLLALGDQLGGALQHLGPRVLGKVAGAEGLVGGLDRAVDQRLVALGDAPDRALVVGTLDLAPLTGRRPLAGDEQLVVGRLHGLRCHSDLLQSLQPSLAPGRRRAARSTAVPGIRQPGERGSRLFCPQVGDQDALDQCPGRLRQPLGPFRVDVGGDP